MANKRYDEFSAGTYDTSKIFLQGDPVTGALEKVNLPTIPDLYIDNQFPNTNNSGSNPQTIATLTVPAAVIDNIGRLITVRAFVLVLSTTGPPGISISFNTANSVSAVGSAAAILWFDACLMRTSSTHITSWCKVLRSLSYSAVSSNFNSIPLATGNTVVVRMTVTAGGANTLFMQNIQAFG